MRIVSKRDHVPREKVLWRGAVLGLALVGRLAGAAWAQQALFFGPIARGKDALGAMFCCGTNVVFRRDALLSVGGFPTASLTEDFDQCSMAE